MNSTRSLVQAALLRLNPPLGPTSRQPRKLPFFKPTAYRRSYSPGANEDQSSPDQPPTFQPPITTQAQKTNAEAPNRFIVRTVKVRPLTFKENSPELFEDLSLMWRDFQKIQSRIRKLQKGFDKSVKKRNGFLVRKHIAKDEFPTLKVLRIGRVSKLRVPTPAEREEHEDPEAEDARTEAEDARTETEDVRTETESARTEAESARTRPEETANNPQLWDSSHPSYDYWDQQQRRYYRASTHSRLRATMADPSASTAPDALHNPSHHIENKPGASSEPPASSEAQVESDPSRPTESVIRRKITAALSPSVLRIHNDSHLHAHHAAMRDWSGAAAPVPETHFRLVIVSESFKGKGQAMRHRLVYKLLEEEMNREGGVHALQLSTRTAEEEEGRRKRGEAAE